MRPVPVLALVCPLGCVTRPSEGDASEATTVDASSSGNASESETQTETQTAPADLAAAPCECEPDEVCVADCQQGFSGPATAADERCVQIPACLELGVMSAPCVEAACGSAYAWTWCSDELGSLYDVLPSWVPVMATA